MEHSPSREAKSNSASQDIPRLHGTGWFITVFTKPRFRGPV